VGHLLVFLVPIEDGVIHELIINFLNPHEKFVCADQFLIPFFVFLCSI
jgi:hypothetical protein